MLQFHPQQPGLRADNIVFVWVIAEAPLVNGNAVLLFCCSFGPIVEGTPAHVEKKSPQARRSL
jgi:hypothetical protein